jgi:CDP-diacylglycerol--glycerol-3-phosphate 3-phosphatidyltransferase
MKKLSLTIPDLLSYFRVFAAPILIIIAVLGYKNVFFTLFAIALITDALDGYLARKLRQFSEIGTRLDGWADLALWVAALICLFILWPDIAKQEAPYALFAIFAFILPMIVGYIKYKELPSYHCYSAKFQAITMSAAVFILLFTGISWPFRTACILQGVAAFEDIAITVVLPVCRCNTPSLWHAIKLKKTI